MNLRRGMSAAIMICGLALASFALAAVLPPIREQPSRPLLDAGLSAHTEQPPALAAARAAAPDPTFSLDGAFYQPNLAQGFADPERRREDLARLARLGGETLWLQYLAHGDYSLLEPWPERQDPVRGLLDDAHAVGLSVWVGTREDPRLWSKGEVPLSVWKDAGEQALRIAEEAAARYGDHPAFAGWYWTPEVVWPRSPGPARLARLTAISRRQIAELRSLLPGAPVAMVLGPGGNLGQEIPTAAWCRFLEGPRPDVLVVMDGVGTGHMDVTQLDLLYAAAAGCAERIGAQLVADVEVFAPDLPPDPGRLRAQMRAASRRASSVVAFDLPHHLQPDSVGIALWSGAWLVRPTIPAEEIREPAGDWGGTGLDLATLDLVPAAPRALGEVTITTRAPHPVEASLSLDDGTGLSDRGPLYSHQGPGRDEITWRRRLADAPVAVRARITLRRGGGGLDVVGAKLIAR